MPEHIRALLVILFLATLVFYFLKIPATHIVGLEKYRLRRNLWYGVTLVAFLSHNYWIYVLLTSALLFAASRRDVAKVSLFIFLLFTVPQGGVDIPGLGLINLLFELNHQRLLSICLLLPAFIRLSSQKSGQHHKKNILDALVIVYILLTVLLTFRGTTFTDTLRFSLHQFLDIYLPYFVVSRALTNLYDFKDVFFSYVIVAMVLSAIGVFEMVKHWNLYSALEDLLNIAGQFSYQERSGLLRARASLNRIPLGYVIAIALGFYIFFRSGYPSKILWNTGLVILVAGLFSPLSRGPWVGAVILVTALAFLSEKKAFNLTRLITIFGISLVIISFTPIGKTVIGLIPFYGEIESGNITYRERVLENSWTVIMQNPLLGSIDYENTPEMQALKQGQGIIDIVNSYMRIGLNYGLVGLSIFVSIFVLACWKVFISTKPLRRISKEHEYLGNTLLAVMLCIMAVIFTVSSVSVIPVIYWTLAGMCSAYVSMGHFKLAETKNSIPGSTKSSLPQLGSNGA